MDASTCVDPQQIHQILIALQEISAKLDSLQSANLDSVNHVVDNVMSNMLSYHFLTQ